MDMESKFVALAYNLDFLEIFAVTGEAYGLSLKLFFWIPLDRVRSRSVSRMVDPLRALAEGVADRAVWLSTERSGGLSCA